MNVQNRIGDLETGPSTYGQLLLDKGAKTKVYKDYCQKKTVLG